MLRSLLCNRAASSLPQWQTCSVKTRTLQVGLAVCAYAGETLAVLKAALADAFHEVNLEACACIQALVGELGTWGWGRSGTGAGHLRMGGLGCQT